MQKNPDDRIRTYLWAAVLELCKGLYADKKKGMEYFAATFHEGFRPDDRNRLEKFIDGFDALTERMQQIVRAWV